MGALLRHPRYVLLVAVSTGPIAGLATRTPWSQAALIGVAVIVLLGLAGAATKVVAP
jgi:hypothetical protein